MKALILAAGMGKRMSEGEAPCPKAMRKALNRPLIEYVLGGLSFVKPQDIVVVVGHMKEYIMENLGDEYTYAVQDKQLGTGHAAACAREVIGEYSGPVLIGCGDMPLVREETYRALFDTHLREGNACTVLTCTTDEKLSFGRVMRDEYGNFARIIEQKDCKTPEELAINELNAGIYIFEVPLLWDALSKLKNDNAQGEFYLTDAPTHLLESGCKVGIYNITDISECFGVNTPSDLVRCEELLQILGVK